MAQGVPGTALNEQDAERGQSQDFKVARLWSLGG